MLFLFWKLVFHTHKSNFVSQWQKCEPFERSQLWCANCRRSALCTFWTSCVHLGTAASHRGHGLLPPRLKMKLLAFLLFFVLIQVLLCHFLFDFLGPGYLPSVTCIMETHSHLSAFRGWIALSQGELLSQIFVWFQVKSLQCMSNIYFNMPRKHNNIVPFKWSKKKICWLLSRKNLRLWNKK